MSEVNIIFENYMSTFFQDENNLPCNSASLLHTKSTQNRLKATLCKILRKQFSMNTHFFDKKSVEKKEIECNRV